MRAYEALHRPLTPAERDDLYDVFRRVGEGLGIPQLPASYGAWLADRERHLENDLAVSGHTRELDRSYRVAVGAWRFLIVRQLQGVPLAHLDALRALEAGTFNRRQEGRID